MPRKPKQELGLSTTLSTVVFYKETILVPEFYEFIEEFGQKAIENKWIQKLCTEKRHIRLFISRSHPEHYTRTHTHTHTQSEARNFYLFRHRLSDQL